MQDEHQTANALTLADSRELTKQLKKPWTLIVCKGEERVFCSGGQLKDYARQKTKEAGLKINNEIKRNLSALQKHTALKIALVGGDCFGGGIEFLGCFDLIYAVPHALFGFWQNKMGVSYGWGGYEFLQRKLSPAFLKTALLEERILTAFELKSAGLIHEIVNQQDLQGIAESWEKSFSAKKSKIEIQNQLNKNADSVFRKLWWAPEHRQILEKIKKKTQEA
jgi:enoyl-CoA hydratase/carnithine racemase